MTSKTSSLTRATGTPLHRLRKFRQALLIGLTLLTVFLVAGISMTIGWRPIIGARARSLTIRKFEATPQRLERGRYIFVGLSGCVHCHSPLEKSQRGFPPVMSMMGAGQVLVEETSLGRIVAPNLTPDVETGSGSWTDDQLARAIREGIGHDGRTLFPMMPYRNFRAMSDEDLASVIVFLRSLPPIRRDLPKTAIAFPVKYLIKGLPQPVTSAVSAQLVSDRVQWGKYLVRMANCAECHSARGADGKSIPGMDFASGIDGGPMKYTVRDTDTGEVKVFQAPPLTAETLAKALSHLFDRSFEASVKDGDGRQVIQMRDKGSGQDVITLRDVAIVMGRTTKGEYKLIDRAAKQTAVTLGVKPLPAFKIPGSKEYGVLRTEFFAWLKSLPAPIRIQKGRKKRKG
jgi:mono/diheme cytochrome c family protein